MIPTFRRPQLLRRAVFSVLNQTYGDLQVHIVDNASGDETEDVAQEFARLDPRVRYTRQPTNIGGLQNMIVGMERVTTPFFNVLCDDDSLMPTFLDTGIKTHQSPKSQAVLVSARVVVADQVGRITEGYSHPVRERTLTEPDGAVHCLKFGMSIPGVIYRTAAMATVGPPRHAWWNWTESGWHALAAMRYPIQFTPNVGAIVLVHPGSASKRMDGAEFRASWFAMLAELRAAASIAQLSPMWWNRHVLPIAYSRFLGTVARLCTREGATRYTDLEVRAVASGLNAAAVAGVLTLARAARVAGVGAFLNGLFDSVRVRAQASTAHQIAAGAPDDPDLSAAWTVWADLNRQAGVG